MPLHTNIMFTVHAKPNALQKCWVGQQERSKAVHFLANNAVSKTIVRGVTYDCHAVVMVSVVRRSCIVCVFRCSSVRFATQLQYHQAD